MSLLKGAIASPLLLMMNLTAAPAMCENLADVEYSRAGGQSLRLDAFIPEGSGPFPAAIIVHGGGWIRGDRKTDVAPLFQPLEDAGIAWFSISYRLATNVLDFGVAVSDVDAAVGFVKANAAEYRIDPDRIALIGESAGGQLAAMAALRPSPGNDVRAVVAFYTPTDLATLAKNSDLIPDPIRRALSGSPFESVILARLSQLSPIEHVHPGMPPFLLIHGTADGLVDFEQSPAMCRRVRGTGAACEVFTVPGGAHGVGRWEGSPAISEPYKREMVRWLNSRFAGAPEPL